MSIGDNASTKALAGSILAYRSRVHELQFKMESVFSI